MKRGLGLDLGGNGNRLPRYVTDFANGFELPGNTYTGGPTVVELGNEHPVYLGRFWL